MTTTDHAAAFMEAVKGIPAHFVTRALHDFTTGTDWTRCSKTHLALCYADAQAGHQHEMHRFKKLTDLQALRQRALELQETTRKYRQDQAAAHERAAAEVQAAHQARKALLADAARWRKLLQEVGHGRATVTPLEHASIAHAEGLAAYVDTIQAPT